MILIGIAGGSGSGKSTLCRRLQGMIRADSNVLTHDSYYHCLAHLSDAQRAAVNYDHPDALETELLCEHLDTLRLNRPVDMPTYCFETHVRQMAVVTVGPPQVLFVDGVLLLCEPNLVRRFDLTVYVRAADEIRLARRLARDTTQRGRTRDSVIQQWRNTVIPMHRRYVEPFQVSADFVIDNDQTEPDLQPVVERINAMLAAEQT